MESSHNSMFQTLRCIESNIWHPMVKCARRIRASACGVVDTGKILS